MSRKKINISDLNLKKINDRFIYIRLMSGERQEEFAENIGISKTTVSNIENDKHDPSYLPIKNIILKYDLNPIWLLTGGGEPYINKGMEGLQSGLYNKVSDWEKKASHAPIYKGIGEEGFKMSEALAMAARVLESNTSYAVALFLNIQHFDRAIQAEDRIADLEQSKRDQADRIAKLESECEELRKRLANLEEKYKLIAPQDEPEEAAA